MVAIVGLLVALGGGAALTLLGRGTAEAAGIPVERPKAVKAPAGAKAKAPESGLPPALAAALSRHEVVVVALVAPGSTVDDFALAEARAGARAARAGFVAVNVLRERDARAFARLLGVLEPPLTLVYRRPDRLALRLEGFVDLDTVAQAVLDARRAPAA